MVLENLLSSQKDLPPTKQKKEETAGWDFVKIIQIFYQAMNTRTRFTYGYMPGKSCIFQGLSRADAGGPAHQFLIRWAAARPGPSNFQRMGRGPTRPIKFSEDGPRPGPAHHIFKTSRPGPVRPIFFSKVSARPGPAHHMAARPMKYGLYVGRPDNYVDRPVDLTGQYVVPY